MLNKERFLENTQKYNIDAQNIFDALNLYAKMLVDYNKKVNLTAITDAKGIENKHFIDSLLLASLDEVQGKLVDVGTGAGFPGIVVKLFKPEISLTLMEPTGKRVEFLKFICKELALNDVDIVKERAEEAARKQWREQFDVATARAVAGLNVLCEFCIPLVKDGGFFLAMKGANGDVELDAARNAINKLGAKTNKNNEIKQYILPDNSVRTIILCEKISQTARLYPRNGGKIAKAPLV